MSDGPKVATITFTAPCPHGRDTQWVTSSILHLAPMTASAPSFQVGCDCPVSDPACP